MRLRRLALATVFCLGAGPAVAGPAPSELRPLNEGEAAYACSLVLFDFAKQAQRSEDMKLFGREASQAATQWTVRAQAAGFRPDAAGRIRAHIDGLSPRSLDAVLFHCLAAKP